MKSTNEIHTVMTSATISRASALALLLGGVLLLFVPDEFLSVLSPGFPADSAWIGQLLGAAWLGVAALNWLNSAAPLGGIYGRPVLFTNIAIYFIGGSSLIRAAQRADFPLALTALAAVTLVFALAYGWLLFRGPFERDLNG